MCALLVSSFTLVTREGLCLRVIFGSLGRMRDDGNEGGDANATERL